MGKSISEIVHKRFDKGVKHINKQMFPDAPKLRKVAEGIFKKPCTDLGLLVTKTEHDLNRSGKSISVLGVEEIVNHDRELPSRRTYSMRHEISDADDGFYENIILYVDNENSIMDIFIDQQYASRQSAAVVWLPLVITLRPNGELFIDPDIKRINKHPIFEFTVDQLITTMKMQYPDVARESDVVKLLELYLIPKLVLFYEILGENISKENPDHGAVDKVGSGEVSKSVH